MVKGEQNYKMGLEDTRILFFLSKRLAYWNFDTKSMGKNHLHREQNHLGMQRGRNILTLTETNQLLKW